MKQLELLSFSMFEDVMLAIKQASEGRITFKTASQLSYEMVARLFGNLYSQIDPIEIGKTSRLMTIAKDYGERLAGEAKNFKRDDALDVLISAYSSHSFVIDRDEASKIFDHVEATNELYENLQSALKNLALYPVEISETREYINLYLNEERTDATETASAPDEGRPNATNEPAGGGQSPDGGGLPPTDSGSPDGAADNHPDGQAPPDDQQEPAAQTDT